MSNFLSELLSFLFTLAIGFIGGIVTYYFFPAKLAQFLDSVKELFKKEHPNSDEEDHPAATKAPKSDSTKKPASKGTKSKTTQKKKKESDK